MFVVSCLEDNPNKSLQPRAFVTKDNGLVGGSNELWIISTSSNYNKYCSTSCGQIITFSRHKTSDLRGKPYSTLDHFHLLHRKNIIQWFSFLHNQILLQKLLLNTIPKNSPQTRVGCYLSSFSCNHWPCHSSSKRVWFTWHVPGLGHVVASI